MVVFFTVRGRAVYPSVHAGGRCARAAEEPEENRGSPRLTLPRCGGFPAPAKALADRAVDVQVTATAAVPAYPLRRQGGVAPAQGAEAEVMTASAQHGMATGQLAADPVAGSDLLRVKPVTQRDGPLAHPISYHDAEESRTAAALGKEASSRISCSARHLSFSDHLQYDAFRALPVPLAVEDALPRP